MTKMTKVLSLPAFANRYVNLAQPRLGAEAIYATDDFFAPKERMLNPQDPVFIDGKYDDNGKWMDGWESRRKRGEGYDYCIVKLCPGMIHGVDIDTSHFTGNYAPSASIDVCYSQTKPDDNTQWSELLPAQTLQGDSHHYLDVTSDSVCTHLRLNIYPDGGVARLRVYGVVKYDWSTQSGAELVDLAATLNGGRALNCSDMHFGHINNLIAPGRGINMGDGWETRRRREPGYDWAILKLGHTGLIKKIEVDTAHFKGNFPHKCSVMGAMVTGGSEETLTAQSLYWKTLLPEVSLSADEIHNFESEVQDIGAVSHVRLNNIPDGGISRLRLYGNVRC